MSPADTKWKSVCQRHSEIKQYQNFRVWSKESFTVRSGKETGGSLLKKKKKKSPNSHWPYLSHIESFAGLSPSLSLQLGRCRDPAKEPGSTREPHTELVNYVATSGLAKRGFSVSDDAPTQTEWPSLRDITQKGVHWEEAGTGCLLTALSTPRF